MPEDINADITYRPGESITREVITKTGMKSNSVNEVSRKLNVSFTASSEVSGKLADVLSSKVTTSLSTAFELQTRTVNSFEETRETTQKVTYTFQPTRVVRLVTYKLVDYYELFRGDGTLILSWEVLTNQNTTVSFPHDANLRKSFSTEISDETNGIALTVFPNPTKGLFKIACEKVPTTSLSLIIYNTIGLPVYQEEKLGSTINEREFDISHLPAGLYTIKVFGGAEPITKRIVKE
jgi:hypothetical protein